MSLINHFDRDWLDYTPIFGEYSITSPYLNLKVNLDKNFFVNLKLDSISCKEYRVEAAKKCADTLGDNIALCISGGVDSQAMLQCFIESEVKFTPYVFVYNNDLNKFDVEYARKYCNDKHVDLIEVPFNIINFLNRDNYDTGIKYKSVSPHFNAHYKFCDILREKGHTGICFGGIVPHKNRAGWGNNFVKNSLNYILYSEIAQFPVQGSFLSFYPELTWAIALLTPAIDIDASIKNNIWRQTELITAVRYANKVLGYCMSGLDIYESKKYTGFELVKEHYKDLTGDGWAFEKQFRIPLEEEILKKIDTSSKFVFEEGVEEILTSIRLNH